MFKNVSVSYQLFGAAVLIRQRLNLKTSKNQLFSWIATHQIVAVILKLCKNYNREISVNRVTLQFTEADQFLLKPKKGLSYQTPWIAASHYV